MSKKIMLGLNTFNSDTKISNSNWENRTSEPVWLEQGDTIALKSSFIDTRNRVSGNIILDQDTTIELSYYFYYINRGGTTIKSRVLDTPIVPPATTPPTQLFPNRQQLCQEYYNPTNDYTKDPGLATIPPTGVAFTTPVANNSQDKIPDNLAPLAESIYHTYGPDKVKNWVVPRSPIPLNEAKKGILYQITDKAETSDADFNSIGCPIPIYNGKVFKATEDGTGIVNNPNPEINFSDITALGTAYAIDNPGKEFLGSYDTDWAYVGYNINNYPNNINFTTPNAFPLGNLPSTVFISIVNDIVSIVEGISYTIKTTSDYIDWTLYGAPAPPANTNPVLEVYNDRATLQLNQNYSIVNKGLPFKDGYDTDWLNLGATSPDNISFAFSFTGKPPPFNFPFVELDNVSDILDLKIGMRLYVEIPNEIDNTETFKDWDLLGAPLPAPILASQNFPNSFKASIVSLGAPFNYNGHIYDTNWGFLGDGNLNPQVGDSFIIVEDVDPVIINVDNDFLAIKNGVTYSVGASENDIDWSVYGATPSTILGDVIPVSQAVPGTIYQIVDYGVAYNNPPYFDGTDTYFYDIGAQIITPKPTRFLCNKPFEGGFAMSIYAGEADTIITGMSITITTRGTIGVGIQTIGQGDFEDVETEEPFDWSQFGGPNITDALPATFTATKDFAGLNILTAPYDFNLTINPTATIQSVSAYSNFTFTANKDVTEIPATFTGNALTFFMNVVSTGTIQPPFLGDLDFTITKIPSSSQINPSLTIHPTYIYPTGSVQLTTSYEVPFTFTATSTGSYAYYDNQGVNRANLTYTADVIPTGSVQAAYEIAQLTEITNDGDNYILANNPVGFNNTQDVNQPDGLPYILTYCVPKNVDGSTNFDPSILDPGDLVPFIKKWKMTLKAGSYSPDYMAEVISRGMSVQKTKINTISTINTGRNSFLGTPNQGIHSQMYKSPDLSYLKNWDSSEIQNQISNGTTNPASGYFGYSARDCKQGPFPYKNQIPQQIVVPPQLFDVMNENNSALNTPLDINRSLAPETGFVPVPPTDYQPQLFFTSKNKNIMPGYNGNTTTLPTTLPVNPKYTDLDFNNPDSDYADDNPFVYRPNAFTHVDKNQTQGNVRLIYNDYNLNNYNDMPVFGNTNDDNIKCIEMMYRPLINDVDSSYYNNIQEKFGLPVTKQYSIRPVISASVASSSATAEVDGTPLTGPNMPAFNITTEPSNPFTEGAFTTGNAVGYSAPCDISTPVVGANLMSLTYNNENNGLFEFPYMHTPIYTKPLTTGSSLQEVTAMYPSSITTYTGASASSSKITWSSYISSTTTFKEQSVSLLEGSTPTFTGAYYQNNIYYLDTFNAITNTTDLTQPGYFVYSGTLFPGGIEGINDLTINVLTWNPTPFSGGIVPATISVSGIAPSATSSQNFQTNSNVIQIGSQSGIIFKDMIATKADGSSMPFWEQLGFDVPNITHKYDPKNPNDFTLSYETFTKSTTTGFQGTSTIFDPETLASGTTEMSYVSYVDSLNMLGWYVPTTYNIQPVGLGWCAFGGNTDYNIIPEDSPLFRIKQNVEPGNGLAELVAWFQALTFQGNFVLQNKILYSSVETTNSLAAKIVFSDFTDTGHALVSIEGYNGSVLLTNNDKLNVKSLVSTYYTGPNAFITNSLSDSAIYEHVGMPMKLQNFKTRILSPYTQKELTNLGPNSSIYLEITKTLNKDNATNITFDN
jgi:hypothetical protein